MEKITSLSQLDANGVYSYLDYISWQFDQRVELIKGKIFPMAAPNRRHQIISRQFYGVFFSHFQNKSCEYYPAPFDVRLYDSQKPNKKNQDFNTVIQPDICVICDLEKLDDKGCQGAPDLVIEILSAGNSKKEMKIKKQLYEENLIREYWIIDPEHETVHQFVLGDNQLYNPPIIYVSEDVVYADIFKELQVPLEKVFIY